MKLSLNLIVYFLLGIIIVLLLVHLGATQDDESGGLPSHLPSPKEKKNKGGKKKAQPTTTAGTTTNRPVVTVNSIRLPTPPPATTSGRLKPNEVVYYDDNNIVESDSQYDEIHEVVYDEDLAMDSESPSAPVPESPPALDDDDEPPPPPPEEPEPEEPEEPPHRAIFGLDHIILILVPSFKTKLPHLPKWAGSNVRVALPITIFFDKLTIRPPPLPRPVTLVPLYGPFFPAGHFVKKRSLSSVEMNEHEAVAIDESIYGAERVMLIPRLEKLLGSFGLGGKPCLLRAICETHEVPLVHHGYGLLGELLTLFFSISRSAFANTHHLVEYLQAEESGKRGNCSKYFETCPTSIFYWEKTHHHNEGGLEESHPKMIGLNETHYHQHFTDDWEEEYDDEEEEDDVDFNELLKQILSSRDLLK